MSPAASRHGVNLSPEHRAALERLIASSPHSRQADIIAAFRAETGRPVAKSSIYAAKKRMARAGTYAPPEPAGRRMGDEAREVASDPANISRAIVVARKVAKATGVPRDILESAAMLGLCHAARDYDLARGTCFRTLFERRVGGEVMDEVRRWSHSRRSTRLVAHGLEVDEGAEIFDSRESSPSEAVEFHDFVAALTGDLPPRQREVVRMAYLDCRGRDGLRGVARALGVGLAYVRDVHGKAMREIRSKLAS